MVEEFQKKLSDSPAMRWTALVLLATAMFFGYIFVDILSPLMDLLQTQRGWDPVSFGHYAGSEPFLNVFVFFLIFAGIILDKMGVRFTAILSGSVMVLGAAINWYAVTDSFETSSLKTFVDGILNLPDVWWNITPWFRGMPASAKFAAIGFMIFGCGTEMAGITVSRGIVKWFAGHEMALAMGVEMAIARVGVAVVMLGSPAIAHITPISVSRPVAFALLLLCIGLICFITYGFMDKKLDAQGVKEEKDEPFKVKDIGKILSLKMFWLVALLCVLYYSAIFPFQKYAINMLQCNLDFSAEAAGRVFFVFPLGAAAVTPFLGNYLDRKGKGASMMILGAILMILCHLTFAFIVPATHSVIITFIAIIVLGISFSLVPAAMWPSVPKLIDNKLLGSAYALIFWIQNIGLYAFPMIIGSILHACNPGVTDPLKYNYTIPMCVFASLGVLALILGFALKALDSKKGYGLKNQTSSRFKRWTVLIIVAIVMMMGYVFWDIVSPLSTQLKAPIAEGGMNWTSAEYGFYAGSYSIFNIFLLMLFFGGIILDKCGIRFTGIMATGVMLLGSFINYYALTRISPNVCVDLSFTLFGLIPEHIKLQVLIAALGFGLFGMGCDITGITVSKVVTKWFKGHELASAMGIQVAMARLGTASALSFSPLIAMNFGLSAPILVGAFMLLIGFVLFLIYIFMDKDFDKNKRIVSLEANDESFRFRDFVKVLQNPGFWMIAILCVFFYSSIRPFMKFATDLLINKYGVEGVTAGWIVSALPYATIILTPLFGSIYDRIGKGATLMLIGCVLVTACHICLLLPFVTSTWFATAIMIILGIAFSLVPSAMWPSVPKIVPLKQLGTAYSIIYYIQNLGLMLVPMWVGDVIGQNTTSDGHVDFTMPMMIFVGFGIVAIFISSILLIMDKKKHYGLEDANIIK